MKLDTDPSYLHMLKSKTKSQVANQWFQRVFAMQFLYQSSIQIKFLCIIIAAGKFPRKFDINTNDICHSENHQSTAQLLEITDNSNKLQKTFDSTYIQYLDSLY